jgi:hypothetical protein
MTVPHDAARCRVQSSGTAGNRCAMNRAEQAIETGIGRRKATSCRALAMTQGTLRHVALEGSFHRVRQTVGTAGSV